MAAARPSKFELLNLTLAVIGAWSVVQSLTSWLSLDDIGSRLIAVLVAALGVWAAWLRVTRRPQNVFLAASRSEERSEQLRRAMLEGMHVSAAYDSLAALYERTISEVASAFPDSKVAWPVDGNGVACLVATVSSTLPQELDSLVEIDTATEAPEWERRVSNFAAERQQYITAIRRSMFHGNKYGDEDGRNFILKRVEAAASSVKMVLGTATYGQIVRTSDSLINEFALFGYLSSGTAFRRRPIQLRFGQKKALRVLPWRRAVHSWDSGADLVVAPKGRASGVGVSMALVDRFADEGPSVFIARRSSKVGTYPDVMHVIPSGMMNVHGSPYGRGNGSVKAIPRLTMMSEFLEECYDLEELAGRSISNYRTKVERELSVRGLSDLFPEFTGLAIDLLNLRTEICGALDLSGHPGLVEDFELSWEYSHTDPLQRVSIGDGIEHLAREDFVQSGIGCIHLAHQWQTCQSGPSEGDDSTANSSL